jgi:hypothetical protein
MLFFYRRRSYDYSPLPGFVQNESFRVVHKTCGPNSTVIQIRSLALLPSALTAVTALSILEYTFLFQRWFLRLNILYWNFHAKNTAQNITVFFKQCSCVSFLLLLRSVIWRDTFFYPHSCVADDFEPVECDTLSTVKQSNMVSHWLFLLDCLTAGDKGNGSLGGSGSQSPVYSAADRRKYEYPFSRFVLLSLRNKYMRLDSHYSGR